MFSLFFLYSTTAIYTLNCVRERPCGNLKGFVISQAAEDGLKLLFGFFEGESYWHVWNLLRFPAGDGSHNATSPFPCWCLCYQGRSGTVEITLIAPVLMMTSKISVLVKVSVYQPLCIRQPAGQIRHPCSRFQFISVPPHTLSRPTPICFGAGFREKFIAYLE